MHSQLRVSCVTDLEKSTPTTEAEGHDSYLPRLQSFHHVTESLAQIISGGKYQKNTGDGDILTFESPDAAINFAMQLQAYYADTQAIERPTFSVRVGLFDGVVQETSADVFGSGVNQASRLAGIAQPGQVILNRSLRDHMQSVVGSGNAAQYFDSIGEHDVRGIGKHELFSFNWRLFGETHPDSSLTRTVIDHLRRGHVELSNLNIDDLKNAGNIVWPVVPRTIATAIHKGQAEIIRLLALLGWRVNLMVADCKAGNVYTRAYSQNFHQTLQRYLTARGIGSINTTYLSDFYLPSYEFYDRIQDLFRLVVSEITLQELQVINVKHYDSKKQDEISKSPTLDFLRPALSIAAVVHVAEQLGQKVIVVAGADEGIQWQRAYDIADARQKIGVLMNPVLNQDQIYQDIQKASWPSWPSEEALVRDMSSDRPTNLAWWVFNLHSFIPSFPSQQVVIEGENVKPEDWLDKTQMPSNVNTQALAHEVWPLLAIS